MQADNKGFQLLAKMGWKEGGGLGPAGEGITAPVGKGKAAGDNAGLGLTSANEPSADDDEFAEYRKRMMLAYRFRPNPLVLISQFNLGLNLLRLPIAEQSQTTLLLAGGREASHSEIVPCDKYILTFVHSQLVVLPVR